MVREARKAVGRRKKLELLVLGAQSLVDQIELAPTFTKTRYHMIENIGQVPDFAATRSFREIYREISRGHFSCALGKPIERTGDEQAKSIRRERRDEEEQDNHEESNISEAAHLGEC